LRQGAYRIEAPAGRGASAIIYRAVQTACRQEVAIKEFFPLLGVERHDEDGVQRVVPRDAEKFQRELERFIREGEILAAVHHRNAVGARDVFEESGTAYIVMDYVAGPTLTAVLRGRPSGHLETAEVENVVGQLVACLEAMHREGIYHLDIAPDNVLYTAEGRAALIDFGAARRGRAAGSDQPFKFEYAPVEAIAGRDVGPESDLFELAMMTHELLTGSRPRPALQRVGVPHLSLPALEQPWRDMLEGALHLTPDERPHSVRQWWDAGFPADPVPGDPR
jgi:serine/threonine protein kinase